MRLGSCGRTSGGPTTPAEVDSVTWTIPSLLLYALVETEMTSSATARGAAPPRAAAVAPPLGTPWGGVRPVRAEGPHQPLRPAQGHAARRGRRHRPRRDQHRRPRRPPGLRDLGGDQPSRRALHVVIW